MRTFVLLSGYMLFLIGCREDIGGFPDGFCEHTDLKGSKDMASNAKCAAAAGLAGDNLICVDFNQISTLMDQRLMGWDFTAIGGNCWQLMGGKLQVNSFSNFMGSCGFTMPALSISKYNSFTLSVVHTVNIDEANQKIQVMLGVDDPSKRLVDQTTGKQPRKQWVHTIAKTALPNGGSGTYQPLFKIVSGITIGLAGWQIESIAVNGNL